MLLCEHPDFEQAIIQAAAYYSQRGLKESFIEKDYYVTEVLRIIANNVGDKVIFKGGTSLSKGWNLIERLSEDIDLFLDPKLFCPELGKKQVNRELKKIRDIIVNGSNLTFLSEESQTIGGFGRSDRFSYQQFFGGVGEVANRVLIEIGTASGKEPTAIVQISSYLAQFLRETNVTLGAEDEMSFPFNLLHFRRTFVEKLFAIHGKVEIFRRDNKPIGAYARHYYDLSQLVLQPEVINMLRSNEYEVIKEDYHLISSVNFGRDYFFPENMRFINSSAIFPITELSNLLKKEYEVQCKMLCYGTYPSWEEVLSRFNVVKELL